MRLVHGTPFVLDAVISQRGEAISGCAPHPVRGLVVLVSATALHFWSTQQHVVYLTSVTVPGTSAGRGGDAATHCLWHPTGKVLAVATSNRRVVFYDVDILLSNEDVLPAPLHPCALRLANVLSRVRYRSEMRLDNGLITGLCNGGKQSLLLCTSGGFVCVVGWFHSKVLHVWNAAFLLRAEHTMDCQQAGTAIGTSEAGVRVLSDSKSAALSGTVIGVSHCIPLQLTAILLSDGMVALLRGFDDHTCFSESVVFRGTCSRHTSAVMLSINVRHNLIVFATHSGNVVCRHLRMADLVMKPFWNTQRWLEDGGSLGPVSSMAWSPSEETLCVGFQHRGVVLLHFSGICLFSSFPRHGDAPARPLDGRLPLLAQGCCCMCWDQSGYRLFAVEQGASSSLVLPLVAVASTSELRERCECAPVLCYDGTSLYLLHGTESERTPVEWEEVPLPAAFLRTAFPVQYCVVSSSGEHVACAGRTGVAVYNRRIRRWNTSVNSAAGKAVTYVSAPVWLMSEAILLPARIAGASEFDLRVHCRSAIHNTPPLLVIPLSRKPVLVRSSEVDRHGSGLMVVLTSAHVLHIFMYGLKTDNVFAPLRVEVTAACIATVALSSPLHYPLDIVPLQRMSATGAVPSVTATPSLCTLLVLQSDHQLVAAAVSVSERPMPTPEMAAEVQTRVLMQEPVFSLWRDSAAPLPCSSAIFAYADRGMHCLVLETVANEPSTLGVDEGKAAQLEGIPMPTVRYHFHFSPLDGEMLPLGISPYDGFIIMGTEGRLRGDGTLAGSGYYGGGPLGPSLYVSVKPLLYQHVLVAAALADAFRLPRRCTGVIGGCASDTGSVNELGRHPSLSWPSGGLSVEQPRDAQRRNAERGAMDGSAAAVVTNSSTASGSGHGGSLHLLSPRFYAWLERMRENSSFTPNMDYFLHFVTSDRDSMNVDFGNDHTIIQQIVSLLRLYPEFHEIVVRFVRKIDLGQWQMVLDIIGSPVDYFHECVASNRLLEGAHLVRVIMMAGAGEDRPKVFDAAAREVRDGVRSEVDSLATASRCARCLFVVLLHNGDYELALDVLRFAGMIGAELGGGHPSTKVVSGPRRRSFSQQPPPGRTSAEGQRCHTEMREKSQANLGLTSVFQWATGVNGESMSVTNGRTAGPQWATRGSRSLPDWEVTALFRLPSGADSVPFLRPQHVAIDGLLHADSTRHSAAHAVLERFPELAEEMEAIALRLLASARLIELELFFSSMALDLVHFVRAASAAAPCLHRRPNSPLPASVTAAATQANPQAEGRELSESTVAGPLVNGPANVNGAFGRVATALATTVAPNGTDLAQAEVPALAALTEMRPFSTALLFARLHDDLGLPCCYRCSGSIVTHDSLAVKGEASSLLRSTSELTEAQLYIRRHDALRLRLIALQAIFVESDCLEYSLALALLLHQRPVVAKYLAHYPALGKALEELFLIPEFECYAPQVNSLRSVT